MKRIVKPAVTTLCVAVSAVVVLVLLVPAMLGMQRYVITGGSMTGTIDKGSVVYSRLTPVGQLRVGDIVTFVPPDYPGPVTHRIIKITEGKDGRRVFQTKGDHNKAADPWRSTFSQPLLARYAFHVPYLGYALAVLSIRSVRLLLIALPAIAIALSLMVSLWRSAGEEVRRREAACSQMQTTSASSGAE